jgi:TolA-binding protein
MPRKARGVSGLSARKSITKSTSAAASASSSTKPPKATTTTTKHKSTRGASVDVGATQSNRVSTETSADSGQQRRRQRQRRSVIESISSNSDDTDNDTDNDEEEHEEDWTDYESDDRSSQVRFKKQVVRYKPLFRNSSTRAQSVASDDASLSISNRSFIPIPSDTSDEIERIVHRCASYVSNAAREVPASRVDSIG